MDGQGPEKSKFSFCDYTLGKSKVFKLVLCYPALSLFCQQCYDIVNDDLLYASLPLSYLQTNFLLLYVSLFSTKFIMREENHPLKTYVFFTLTCQLIKSDVKVSDVKVSDVKVSDV